MQNHTPRHALRLLLPVTLLAASLGCDYEAPESEDYREVPPGNVISGEVILAIPFDTEERDLGHVVLLATDAANPGPPEGTGFPYTFTTVPASDFSANTDGLMSAPFTITELYDADWLITGFMDNDNDFSAIFGAFGGATCGDILGAHIDSVFTQNIVPVSVSGGELVDNVAVALGQELVTERPAFTIEASPTDGTSADGPDIQLDYDGTFPQSFVLRATEVAATGVGFGGDNGGSVSYTLDGPIDLTDPQTCQTGILVTAYDRDGDGDIDDNPDFPGQGLSDIWPRVYLSYLGTSQAEDGTWINNLEEGESWNGLAAYNPLAVGTLHGIAAVDGRDNDADGSVDESGEKLLNTPVVLPEADFVWLPAGLYTDEDGESEFIFDPNELPVGYWDITVIQESGQTWTVPNDLAFFGSDSEGYEPARQGEALRIKASSGG